MPRNQPCRTPPSKRRLRPAPERLRRRADHLRARGRHAHHREPALVGAVGAEAEHAVDAGEARLVGQRLLGEARRALRLHQRGDERHRVIGERRGAHRVLPVARAIAARESAEAGRLRRREPAALRARLGENARIVPQAGADQLDAAHVHAARGERLHGGRDRIGAVRNEDRIDLPRRLRDAPHRPLHLRAVERIALHRDDAAAAARHRLLERRLHHRAVGVVGNERRERALALRDRVADHAIDLGLGQEAQQVHARRRDAGIGRERDHRHAARARDLAGRAHRLRRTAARE